MHRYDPAQTYDWNYAHAPEPAEIDVPPLVGRWEFCGLPVDSPLGVAAGPLLNGRWVRYYAALGFDVLTYKTVRSVERACYGMPNLVPVDVGSMRGDERQVRRAATMRGSWAVSFGMPSKRPDVWRADVEETRRLLPPGKVLVVSVVATEQPGWTLDQLADDYARCAAWAVESGADAVEANFSCPNVCTADGQLYQHPREAAVCAARVREAIGPRTPLLVKAGHVRNVDEAEALVEALGPHADALSMTNSLATRVVDADERLLFDGQPRGICGAAILEPSIAQVRLLRQIVTRPLLASATRRVMEHLGTRPPDEVLAAASEPRRPLRLIGVGGAFSADDVKRYLVAGAEGVHLATAAMLDPGIALKIRRSWG